MIKDLLEDRNRWFKIDGGYVCVKSMAQDGDIDVEFVKGRHVGNFFEEFMPSKYLGIVLVRKNLWSAEQ